MSKLNKKGRNLNGGPLDFWLDSLGYYRKNVAYDETCLFRAVSEQLFSCQLFHEKVRLECIQYAEQNMSDFADIISENQLLVHLEKLKMHMVICGDIEIYLIRQKYKKNIVLFNGNQLSMTETKIEEANGTLSLCFMGEDHYDVVYRKEYISNAGFCQSIAYGILYKYVFNMTQVEEIVDHMLNEKPSFSTLTSDEFKETGLLLNSNKNTLTLYNNNTMTNTSNVGNVTDGNVGIVTTSNNVTISDSNNNTCTVDNVTNFDTLPQCLRASLPISTSNDSSNSLDKMSSCGSTKNWVGSKLQMHKLQLPALGMQPNVYGIQPQMKRFVSHQLIRQNIEGEPFISTESSPQPLPAFPFFPPTYPTSSQEEEDRGEAEVKSEEQHELVVTLAHPYDGGESTNDPLVLSGGWLCTGSEGIGGGMEEVRPLTDLQLLLSMKIAPFPYKVAKALDPNIYRNIEYDSWAEMRKEMRLCNWYYGDTNYKEGAGCRLYVDGVIQTCYIQSIHGDTCDVFLTQSAERKTVNMTDLYPEEDAKPWPIPYRFTKNTIILSTDMLDKYHRNRKRRDKKRTTSNGSSNPSQDDHTSVNPSPYEGCPLVHQQSNNINGASVNVVDIDTSLPPPALMRSSTTSPPSMMYEDAPPSNTTTTNTFPLAPILLAPPPPPPMHILPALQQQAYSIATGGMSLHPNALAMTTAAEDSNTNDMMSPCVSNSNSDNLVVWERSYWESGLPTPTPTPTPEGGAVGVAPVFVGGVSAGGGGGGVTPTYVHYTTAAAAPSAGHQAKLMVPVSPQTIVGPPTPYGAEQQFTYGQLESHYYYNNDPVNCNIWTGCPGNPALDGNVTVNMTAEGIPYMVAASPTFLPHPMSPQVEMYPAQYAAMATGHGNPVPICTPPGTPLLYSPYHHPHLLAPPSPYQDHPHLHPHPHHLHHQLSTSSSVVDVPYIPTPTYVYPTTPTWYPPGINATGFIFPTAPPLQQQVLAAAAQNN